MKKFPFVHVALFILTLLSTLSVGAMQTGVDLLKEPEKIYKGLPFALSLMIILLSHELSHYFTSKKHGVKATLPYFIPAPTFIGTLGAFIKMKSPIFTRKALVDIGASGPVAGFIVSVIVTIIGLHLSKVVPAPQIPAAETRDAIIVYFGNSLIFSSLSQMTLGAIPSGWDILLHPVARAGWIGLFVTSINLIPVGQLDGGHVAYALFGGKIHKRTSVIIFGALLFMGVAKVFTSGDYFPGILNSYIDLHNYAEKYFWEGWAVWAVLLFVLGLKHPPVLYWETPLDYKRRFIGWLSLVIFILTFIPVPFKVS